MIIKIPKRTRYVVIANAVAQDSRLSFEARGVLLYLMSHPDEWKILASDIEKAGNIGVDKRRRIMSELEQAGYLTFHRRQGPDGRFSTESILHEVPVSEPERTRELGRGVRNGR